MPTKLDNLHKLPPPPAVLDRVTAGELDTTEDYYTYPAPGRAMDVVRRLGADLFSDHAGVPTLRYWRGRWWSYRERHWGECHDDEVRQRVWQRLDEVTYRKDNKGKEEHAEWLPTQARVNGVMEPLRLTHLVPPDTESPTWTGKGSAPGQTLIAMGNGLFDVDSQKLHDHTPHWFTTWSVPFNYDPKATCPTWTAWLDEVFAHDPKARDAVQEFMGYLLSGRKDIQKGLLLVGVPRGGKSTFNGVVTALMGGTVNVSAPSLNSLNEQFGLAQIIDKPLMIIGDARNAAKGSEQAVERLLGIIGNDSLTIQQKGKDDWVGVPPARVMISTNEVPRFIDASGAIATRFIAVYLEKTFEGEEDRSMPEKLRAELPGIFLWALEGLERLKKNGNKFTVPDTQEKLLESVREQAAPVRTFLQEVYELTGDELDSLPRKEVVKDYAEWCEANGYQRRNAQTLAEAINAASIPGVRSVNRRDPRTPDAKKARAVTGIKKTNIF